MNDNDPCPHCGALCADVELARTIRVTLANYCAVLRIETPATPTSPFAIRKLPVYDGEWREVGGTFTGDTLDAALDQLAKKIGGSDER